MSEETLLASGSVKEYFRGLFGEVRESQGVQVTQVTEFYLSNLLADFLSAENLYTTREDGSRDIEPFALLLARAMQAQREERIRLLRRMGDVSLYICGFFSDSLERKTVDVTYYIAMGENAYGQLASMMRWPGRGKALFGEIYDELTTEFRRIVDVFAEISERVAVSTNQGIVRMYDRWVRTGSERLTRLLAQQGVLPMPKPRMAQ